MERKQNSVMNMCRLKRTDKLKDMLATDPELILTRDPEESTLAFYGICRKDVTFLQFLLDTIRRFPEERQGQLMFDVFESANMTGIRPIHFAAKKDLRCLKFLLEHCSGGVNLLDIQDNAMRTAAHYAGAADEFETLEFIVYHCREGIKILSTPDVHGHTPLSCSKGFFVGYYFTDKRIQQIGLNRELEVILGNCFFEANSLVSLMLGVISEDTRVRAWRVAE